MRNNRWNKPLRSGEAKVMKDFIKKDLLNRKIDWLAISLTLRQGAPRDDRTIQILTVTEVSKCVKHFMKEINRQVYGKANRRYSKRLIVVPTFERDSNNRLHVHMLLEVPDRCYMSPIEFKTKVGAIWDSMRWALVQKDLAFIPTPTRENVSRWLDYIMKTLPINQDAIDLHNLYLCRDRNVAEERARQRQLKNAAAASQAEKDARKHTSSTQNLTNFYTD